MSVVATFLGIIFIGVLIALYIVNSQEHTIKQRIHNMGGQVLNIELKTWDTGPFKLVNHRDEVYKVTYVMQGGVTTCIGWVKFGWNVEWRL